ncbi:TldD/PmbA family protein [Gloeobacter kilaueensis]|uniref:Peptidase PmbA n=1 Tax=Gloeobacter kilaueensis (strain ATCC BAA-2537 / CCAP 1431/1 / ULC 316 / JS1) TaxID=1183438 RepID=U5QLH4_GLOK1|nr:TldD/PmbA family protein [Gloeobacter kilaueensis]AGY59802.1 peptidase PmbA [Gloeobacter kilaueensis JS1]
MATLSESQARKVVASVLKYTTAKDVLVSLDAHTSAVTRFANNAITQNTLDEGNLLEVRVAFDERHATSTISSFDEEAIKAAVGRAEALARVAPPDPEHLPPLPPQQYLAVEAYDPATAKLDAAGRARQVLTITQAATKKNYRAAGTVETGETIAVVANSAGLFGYHRRTDVQVGCTVQGADSSGWARDTASQIALIDPASLVGDAISQVQKGASPVAMGPGKYTVILAPAAVGTLLTHLLFQLDARETLDGVTFLSGKMGQKLVGDNITLYSDPTNSRLPTRPFASDGLAQPKLNWIDKGAFTGLRWDRFTAQKNNRSPVPFPDGLLMQGSDKAIADLIASVDRGIFVTHVWYVRDVKADETIVTGLTRDGTFLIEDGKIARGVKTLRFNESILEMLSKTLDLSRPQACADTELNPSLLPAIKVADFNFVSGSPN